MKTAIKVIVTVFIFLGLVSFQPVFAQSEELQSALEDVAESVGAIEEEISPEEEIKTKQEALVSVFDFSLTEISELLSKDRLGIVKKSNDEDLAQIAELLEEALASYKDKIKDLKNFILDEDITLDEIKDVAGDFKEWRENVYDPEIKATGNLILVQKGTLILETANSRLEKISKDVVRLEEALSLETLDSYLAEAKSFIKDAAEYKIQAKTKLLGAVQDLFYNEFILQDGVDGEVEDFFTDFNNYDYTTFTTNDEEVYQVIYPEDFERPKKVEGLTYQLTGILHDKTFEVISAEWVEIIEEVELETSEKESLEKIEESIRALIKKEAQSVMDAYKEFLAMRKIVREALAK